MIDLRSDTVTKPTPAMRRAMADAEVGDDVYGEDPTVNRLQKRAAEIFEKEAALFVPTGSMGNQTAVKVHTKPGQEVVIEERGHIYSFEMATMSAFAGTIARPVKSNDGSGILTWDEIAGALHFNSAYYVAPTGLIALEESPKGLPDDHANAKRLAEGLAELPGVQIDPEKVVTNIVIFNVGETGQTADAICVQLRERDVLTSGFGSSIRAVTHYDVASADIESALRELRSVLAQ